MNESVPSRSGTAAPRARARALAARDILAATARAPRVRRDIEHIQRYCMFIGYPRSGHSLVGSLLDAHPEIVISHELDALRYVSLGVVGRLQLFALILEQERRFHDAGAEWTGHKYSVPGQWQGRFDRILVIGDKKGGRSTARIGRRPELIDRLRSIVRVPVRMVHVVRDPFDNIATMHLRGEGSMDECARRYFEMADVNRSLRRRFGQDVLDVHHDELVRGPGQELTGVCSHLGVDASPSYIDACASIVSPAPHRSRLEVPWPKRLLRDVEARAADVDFLARYAFDG
jgi:Sulfotransferase family